MLYSTYSGISGHTEDSNTGTTSPHRKVLCKISISLR